MPRKRNWVWSGKERNLAIYSSLVLNVKLGLPCWEQDSNLGPLGLASSALTTRPRCLFNEVLILRRDATSRVLFLSQSVLADFQHRKKNTTGFKTRCLSGTSNNICATPQFLALWLVNDRGGKWQSGQWYQCRNQSCCKEVTENAYGTSSGVLQILWNKNE